MAPELHKALPIALKQKSSQCVYISKKLYVHFNITEGKCATRIKLNRSYFFEILTVVLVNLLQSELLRLLYFSDAPTNQ